MGMFDNIYCEMDLPDGFVYTHAFQSKDMETCTYDCGTMSDFFIHKDGTYDVKFNHNENCDLEKNYKLPHKFNFYGHADDREGEWHEYSAYTDGEKVIKLVSCVVGYYGQETSYKFSKDEMFFIRRIVQAKMDDHRLSCKEAIQIMAENARVFTGWDKEN